MAKVNTYEVEALLRPIVEFWSASTALVVSVLLVLSPKFLMLTPSVAWSAAAAVALLGVMRAKQGLYVYRYHKGLKRLPYFEMAADDVPISNRYLFLGRGFEWKQTHTQRLRDVRSPNGALYLEHSAFYKWARQAAIELENVWLLSWLAFYLNWDHFLNIARPYPDVGGSAELHAVGILDEHDIYEPLSGRYGHKLIVGTTRVGKTRHLEINMIQDIRRGDITIVLDPKGDVDVMVRLIVESTLANRPYYIFHLGFPEISARYNGIGQYERLTEVAGRVTEKLPSAGNSAAFKEFSWRFVNIIAVAMNALGIKPSYEAIRRYINNIEPLISDYAQFYFDKHNPGWQNAVQTIQENINDKNLAMALKGRNKFIIAISKFVEEAEIYDPVMEGLLSAFKYDRTYFDKIVSSLGPLLEKLTTGKVSELLSPDYLDVTDKRPIFTWHDVVQQGANVYIGLDALSDSVVAGVVGSSMFSDATSYAGRLYKHGLNRGLPNIGTKSKQRSIIFHADEFNELVGDDFIPMVNKAGGAGFIVNAYTQTLQDILAGIGDQAKAEQILGNFNALVMLRVKNLETAKLLTEMLPKVTVNLMQSVAGASDSSDPSSGVHFTSNNQDRVTTQDVEAISPGDIMNLPKGQAFVLIEGSKLFKVRFPMPAKADKTPDNFMTLINEIKQKNKLVNDDSWKQEANKWWAEWEDEYGTAA